MPGRVSKRKTKKPEDSAASPAKKTKKDETPEFTHWLMKSEPESRFVSTSIIGGACSSVWDCGEEAAGWISKTLTNKETGLRLVYHYSQVSMRSHSPQVRSYNNSGEMRDENVILCST